jgi:predicted double-glycine peptidase
MARLRFDRYWLAGAALLLTGGCSDTLSSNPKFVGLSPAGDFAVPLQTVEERKFASVVRQRFDFSCGSAALATLLRYHYGVAETEEASFRGMWAQGDREQIRKLGFSLLDMKRYLATRGLEGQGFKVSLDQIAKAGVPGIALVTIKNYRHFVVVKGVANGEVLVGDPSLGLRSVPADAFAKDWNGIFFIIDPSHGGPAGRFNSPAQWASYARAPIGNGFVDPLSVQALALTAPFYRDF